MVNYADGTYFYGPETRRSYASNSTIDVSGWHFIVAIVNSATDMKIYVDCAENGGTYSGTGQPLQYSLLPGCLGRHDRSLSLPADYFKGYIDDFRYWKRALNTDDIARLCNEEFMLNVVQIHKKQFGIFPNPVSQMLTIQRAGEALQSVRLYNAFGKEVYAGTQSQIDMSGFSAGVYLLRIEGEKNTEIQKVIVK